MRVFMLGWEFPPFISGGLGTACYGLTKGPDEVGVDVVFVLPTAVPVGSSGKVMLRTPASPQAQATTIAEAVPGMPHVRLRKVDAVLNAYGTPASFRLTEKLKAGTPGKPAVESEAVQPAEPMAVLQSVSSQSFVLSGAGPHYGGDMMEQVRRYARLATAIAVNENFDVVHAHDWMTYPAGLAVAGITGRPLVVHVHSTEFDRSGENVNQRVYDIERAGMHGADRVICVSHFTRNLVLNRYGVPPEKVTVVYNAVDLPNGLSEEVVQPITRDQKIVLFLGRITMQKGPEYFLAAAKKVLEKYPNVRFIMAGSGDMFVSALNMAVSMGIGSHVTFTGFLRGADVDRAFRMADLYVMPSVSEPFGIAPLEALSHNVPVIISRQSGVSEVLTHALKVDFWDVNEMANKILAVLRHPPLQSVLREEGHFELRRLSWRDSAARCNEIYQLLVGRN